MQKHKSIIITAGIFFDGTGGNTSSSKDTASNIYKLYMQYATNNSQDEIKCKIYISGVGVSESGEVSNIGAATGKFRTGIISKVNNALKQVNQVLQVVEKELPKGGSVKIRYDIFGFSRGAASARHLANMFQSSHPKVVSMLLAIFGKKISANEPAGKTRFIGLFDCVTAVTELSNGFTPNSSDTGDIELLLRPGVAEKVFHITAAHECRYNFAMNSVKPAWPEIELPGSHSDIGGGYLSEEEEDICLTRPAFELRDNKDEEDKPTPSADAENMLAQLRNYPSLTPILLNSSPSIEFWSKQENDGLYTTKPRFYRVSAVVIRRKVLNNWSYVSLSVMRDAALDAGIAFNNEDNLVRNLPVEIIPLHQKALLMGRNARFGGEKIGMSTDELCILGKYIHCSANWGVIGASNMPDLFYINRPDLKWARTIYNMEGQRMLL